MRRAWRRGFTRVSEDEISAGGHDAACAEQEARQTRVSEEDVSAGRHDTACAEQEARQWRKYRRMSNCRRQKASPHMQA